MNWTPSQFSAITARNDSILVSAAAGSGKTAVLVERVLSLLREGGQIDRMLIVTFTHAAAGEMRQRIAERLDDEGENDAHLHRQALKINRAAITTLHSFCKTLISENFAAIPVDPACRIGNQDVLARMLKSATDAVLESAYAAPTPDEEALFDRFEDAQVEDMLSRLRAFLMAQAAPWDWVAAQCSEEKFCLSNWLPRLMTLVRDSLSQAEDTLARMFTLMDTPGAPLRYQDALNADSLLMDDIRARAENGTLTGGKTAFVRLSTKRAPDDENPALTEAYKSLRETWKKQITTARALLPDDPDAADLDMKHTLPPFRALCGLARRIDERYFALKQDKNLLDYNDLEHLALKLMQHDAIRAKIAAEYDTLFVDEYQDVSGTQEAILTALHVPGQNSLFMVGDVKQSIYRFRLADPTLFLRKYADYSQDEDAPCRKILLQNNFRSDKNILLAVNQVFVHAMRRAQTEIDYDAAAALYPGPDAADGEPVEIYLLTASDPESDEENAEENVEEKAGENAQKTTELKQAYLYEAAFIAQRIHELKQTARVRDKNGERPMRWRDVAILVRNASGRAPYLARVLQLSGIPVYSDADAQFFDLPEVVDLCSLLQVIDNPYQDLPLLAAMHSPCFGFSENELGQIRIVNRQNGVPFHRALTDWLEREGKLADKVRAFWAQLAHWRYLSLHIPLDVLVWRVALESGLYMRAGAQPDGDLAQANLRLMVERAQGDTAQNGLNAFLRGMSRLHASDDSKTAKTLGENEDVVRILTLHKSKGLEFPIVFLAESARTFRDKDDTNLILHAAHGAGMQYIDAEARLTHQTAAQRVLLSTRKKESRSEECRLLYVGMTRARSRLIIVGSPRDPDKAMEKWSAPLTPAMAGSAECMLDWVMEAIGGWHEGLFTASNGSVFVSAMHPIDALPTPADRYTTPVPELAQEAPSEETVRAMTRVIPPLAPLKSSVTAISRPVSMPETWESPEDKRRPVQEAPDELPEFLRPIAPSPVQRGITTHKALGLIDYALVRQGRMEDAVEALHARGVLSDEEKRVLSLPWLRGFFASEVGQQALNAGEVHREWSFDLITPEQTILQGVLDLCYKTPDGWVLVDYKTDRADADTLRSRYSVQINWYAHALETITATPVCRVCLFALREGAVIDIDRHPEWLNIPLIQSNP